MSKVVRTIKINSPIDKVYQVAKNSERFPEFIPDVKKVEILKRLENGVHARWLVDIDGVVFQWEEEDIYHDDKYEITYRVLKGDVDKFEGYWKFKPVNGNSTEVELMVEFHVNLPGISDLILPTLKRKVEENVENMLSAMKTYLEGVN